MKTKQRGGSINTTQCLIYIMVLFVTGLGGWSFGALTHGLWAPSAADGGQAAGAAATRGISRQLKLTGTAHKGAAASGQRKHKWPGDSIHSVLTSSGDPYQNFQTRLMYASYKLVQKMPGGERLTGFTRILHRTVPDILMDEVPTFHSFPHKADCDGWCDYPVANRPWAIKDFFDAVAKNESMIQGAWVFMLESDYIWLQPMKVPGDAYDPSVPGVQFLYDYIMPTHPNAAKEMRKLYKKGPTTDIPASGPAPVLLRLADWQLLVVDYLKASVQMESDEEMKMALAWVREMYAWDVACALNNKKVPIRLEHPPNSTTIVQPPFDEGLDNAALAHYTWGALYHEGLPSKGAKQVYRWEKRDFTDMQHVLKVPHIPMPPEYKDGWILEFDAPLNRKRHNLVVLMLTQLNKAVDTLPDLTDRYKTYQEDLKQLEKERDAKLETKKKEAAAATEAILKVIKLEQDQYEASRQAGTKPAARA